MAVVVLLRRKCYALCQMSLRTLYMFALRSKPWTEDLSFSEQRFLWKNHLYTKQ